MTIHLDKAICRDGSKGGTAALDVQRICVFVGGVAAASQNKCGILAVHIGKMNENIETHDRICPFLNELRVK